jgi:hypothetical protein
VCPGVAAIAVVVLPDRILLSAASYHDPVSHWQTKSPIFVWDISLLNQESVQSDFQLLQRLPTQGAHDVEMIASNHGLFIFFSEDRNGQTPLISSQVFKYNKDRNMFQLVQAIPTDGAHAAELFSIQLHDQSLLFLAVANFGDRHGTRYHAKSPLLLFSSDLGQFVSVFEDEGGVATVGATDWEYFELHGHHYLAVSNEGDLQNRVDPSEISPIYEISLQPCHETNGEL